MTSSYWRTSGIVNETVNETETVRSAWKMIEIAVESRRSRKMTRGWSSEMTQSLNVWEIYCLTHLA